MPIDYTPPQQAPVTQEHQQKQQVDNSFAPALNDSSESTSTSEAQNFVEQVGTLRNVQHNYNNDSYYRFSGGTHVPNPWTLNLSATTDFDNTTLTTIGLQYNFGGGLRKVAKDEIALAHASKFASICTGLVKAEVQIDYELAPEYEKCAAFKPVFKNTTTPKPSNEAALLRQQMQEQIALINAQQEKIALLLVRLEQIEEGTETNDDY